MDNKIQGNENLTDKLKWYAWTLLNHEFGEPGIIKKQEKLQRQRKKVVHRI